MPLNREEYNRLVEEVSACHIVGERYALDKTCVINCLEYYLECDIQTIQEDFKCPICKVNNIYPGVGQKVEDIKGCHSCGSKENSAKYSNISAGRNQAFVINELTSKQFEELTNKLEPTKLVYTPRLTVERVKGMIQKKIDYIKEDQVLHYERVVINELKQLLKEISEAEESK